MKDQNLSVKEEIRTVGLFVGTTESVPTEEQKKRSCFQSGPGGHCGELIILQDTYFAGPQFLYMRNKGVKIYYL